MKSLYKALAIGCLLLPLSLTVSAEEEKDKPARCEHAEKYPGHDMGAMMGQMMSPEHLKAMQAHILAMHDLSTKILAEKDPKKQQALKDQQLELIKAHMAERMAKHHQPAKAKEEQDKK